MATGGIKSGGTGGSDGFDALGGDGLRAESDIVVGEDFELVKEWAAALLGRQLLDEALRQQAKRHSRARPYVQLVGRMIFKTSAG